MKIKVSRRIIIVSLFIHQRQLVKYIRMKRNNDSANLKYNGFSLTEVLIALTVFTIGLLSLVLLFPHGMTAANQTMSLSIATLLAQQKMEDVKRDDTTWPAGTNK